MSVVLVALPLGTCLMADPRNPAEAPPEVTQVRVAATNRAEPAGDHRQGSGRTAEVADPPGGGGKTGSIGGDLLVRADFEDAAVFPSPKKPRKQMELLQLTLPSGELAEGVIYYEDGAPTARSAEVVVDPTDGGNRVLRFWIKEAVVPARRKGRYKGRIQLSLSNLDFAEAYQRLRIYLHPDLEHYRSYPKRHTRFTINELWMGARWQGHPHPFRIPLRIVKREGVGRPLLFLATGEVAGGGPRKHGRWRPIWRHLNPDFEVPVGEWMDVEIGYRRGDASSGRFYVGVKRRADTEMIPVIDVTDWTYNPKADSPVPMTAWQPIKIYTSQEIIDHIRGRGGLAQIYFDDLEILKAWPK